VKNTKKRGPNLSLKKLREIIGSNGEAMTQKQFASMLGVSLALIKAVETGQVPMTEKLARNIEIATGAIFFWRHNKKKGMELKSPPNGKVWGVWLKIDGKGEIKSLGRDYTKEHFERHRRLFASEPYAADAAIREACPLIQEMFKAAAKPGVAGARHRLPSLRASLQDWMREANETFNLGVRLVSSARFSLRRWRSLGPH
jgi:transcriptional regulator with XRE-family HTH domain